VNGCEFAKKMLLYQACFLVIYIFPVFNKWTRHPYTSTGKV